MNQHTGQSRMRHAGRYHRRFSLAAAVAAAAMLVACPVLAQGWWPWSDSEREEREDEGPPIPDEPVYRDPQAPSQYPPSSEYPSSDQPPPSAPPAANWSTKNPICLQLEQRLIQESQRTSQSRDAIPRLEADIRQVEQIYQQSEHELERRRCYEYFLFSKSLRRTRACVDLAQQKDQAKRQLADLEAQRQQIAVSSEQSYRDDIVRELAHNNCGANYVQEARRQDRDSSSSIWQDDEGGNYANGWSPYGGSSSATYRTLCVRLCDGYYFPVSFSTLPSHFEQDEAVCGSKCAAPVELYYYQNPGAAVDQSVALRTQEPYTSLKSAFRYRKELVSGCSCKATEFNPQSKPADGKRAEGAPPATGWEAQPAPQTAPR